MTAPPPLTALAADFIATTGFGDIPGDVMELGKKSILDSLGTGISGSVAPGSVLIRRYAEELGISGGGCTVIGSDLRLAPRFAALANGTAMHADDFDDTLQSVPGGARARHKGRMGVHPTAAVLAAVLAAAEAEGRSGKDLLTACHVGIEVACKVFDATDAGDIPHGLHTTGTCGMVGAAAGVANLLGLDAEVVRRMLGMAGDQASGLTSQFGTMVKPWHAGRGAEGAIVAKDLAVMGFTASETVFESPGGYFELEGGGFREPPIRDLGNPWSFADRGIWLKPFPTGSLSHPAMTKTLELIREHDITADQVSGVRLKTGRGIYETLFHHRPRRALEAKFSLEFCLATLLLEGNLGLAHIRDDFVGRSDVQEMIGLVDYSPFSDAEAEAGDHTLVTSFVEINLKDGRGVSGRIDYGKGSKANPMSDKEVAEKVRLCAEFAAWPRSRADAVIEMVAGLEDLADVGGLTALLSGGG